MKLLMPLLAALLASNLSAQNLDSNPVGATPIEQASRSGWQSGEAIEFKMPSAQVDAYKSNGVDEMTMQAPGVLANDHGESLIAMLVDQDNYVAHGTLTIFKDGGFIYQPRSEFVGEDIFVYQALDANGVIVTATITFYCQPAEPSSEIQLEGPGMPASDDDAASCSAARSTAPWLLLPMLGLALMKMRRARA